MLLLIEWGLFACGILYLFSGWRAAYFDRLGHRADLFVLAIALLVFAGLHALAKRFLLPRLERYFSPVSYDERKILFDLGQQARAATNLDHLFNLIVTQIKSALQAEDVSIFVRQEATGDFLCRVSSSLMPEAGSDEERSLSDANSLPSLKFERDAFVIRRLRSLVLPMEVGPADFEAWTRALETASPALRNARQRECDTLVQIKSRLLLQIKIKDQLVGILSIGPCNARHQYTTADKEMLMSIAGQLALVIENSRLTERMVADERLRRELALASEVQKRLFPAREPDFAAAELAGFCQPARGVGGDYYDFFAFNTERLGIAIADVSGKGMSAALLMSTVQATLRSLSAINVKREAETDSLASLVSMLNRLLCQSTGRANYVTFFYAQFDALTRRLTYVNAGHNPPFVLRTHSGVPTAETITLPNGSAATPALRPATEDEFLKLESGGMVIGMFEQSPYEQETIQMEVGDLLIAFTDGVTEALNTEGEEFGEERLQEILTTVATEPAGQVRDEIVQHVQSWSKGTPQHDDLTFIVLKVK